NLGAKETTKLRAAPQRVLKVEAGAQKSPCSAGRRLAEVHVQRSGLQSNSQRRVMRFEVLRRRWRLVRAGIAPGLEPGLLPRSSLGVADACARTHEQQSSRRKQRKRTDVTAWHQLERNRIPSISSEPP